MRTKGVFDEKSVYRSLHCIWKCTVQAVKIIVTFQLFYYRLANTNKKLRVFFPNNYTRCIFFLAQQPLSGKACLYHLWGWLSMTFGIPLIAG